ncbi:class I SAM-dependent methyltransferase [Dyella choica]|uniref:Methyltransferase domain-containing protein n=1 Tax=Dyella choica TaxID=1927959 RepID=A0A3S0S8Q5_9GAMM|nr:class I SAM-dependent methyltransferase [Dyella choica]RUL73101.1 methyltransferase domain-containing protein [Dyella choica]
MENKTDDLLGQVSRYFTDKLAEHGETARGVDWNGEESQTTRFKQLSRIIETSEPFSVNDLGCGYGALYSFLASSHSSFSYSGIDIAEDMIRSAKNRHAGLSNAKFAIGSAPQSIADYSIASGIFNVHFGRSPEQWFGHIEATLDLLDQNSLRGFAFNCLTTYSDADKMRDYLYYADPCSLFDLCKRRYSRNVALLHDYGLFEFTMLVKKQP